MKRGHSHLPHVALAALLSVLALPGAARAATSCTINATGAVAFGAYDWTSASPTDSLGTITYTCDGTALVFLSQGSSGNYTQRTMLSGANSLGYNLYTDAARSAVWGDFFNGGTVEFAPAGTRLQLQVYGRIPASQNVPPGSYSDSITVTFLF
jgi:spore coat protein U-like protein